MAKSQLPTHLPELIEHLRAQMNQYTTFDDFFYDEDSHMVELIDHEPYRYWRFYLHRMHRATARGTELILRGPVTKRLAEVDTITQKRQTLRIPLVNDLPDTSIRKMGKEMARAWDYAFELAREENNS